MQFVACDLSDLSAVRAFCENWSHPLSALVLNAGVQQAVFSTQPDSGIEQTFAINHLGNAALFFGIKDHLTPDARVVIVSSELHSSESRSIAAKPHYTTAAEVARPTDPAMQGSMTTYSNSKLANVLFSLALSRRTHDGPGARWAVIAMTPGFVPGGGSHLHRDRGMLGAIAMPIVGSVLSLAGWLGYGMAKVSTVPRSGKALADLVTDKEHDGEKGTYYQIEEKAETSKQSQDTTLQDDLWDWTVKELGIDGKV